ncbi:MAG: type II toxin-antitoxin system VapC family toxin [Robiginitomaculum sp.]|nr:type II toxin-antitoxin system VapC family toxin [Robiginitomaculum sp.]
MSYLIDTCALSELRRTKPDANVVRWFEDTSQDGLYLSVLTLGEIRKGVEALPNARRKDKILNWLEHELPLWFEGRILPIDAGVADEWGRLLARASRSLPAIDSLIAATAIHNRLTIVTRNVSDFDIAGVDVFNPWTT